MDLEIACGELRRIWSQASSQEFLKKVDEIFTNSSDPYLLLMTCVQNSKEIYYPKNNTMTAKICFQFEKIITRDVQGKFLKNLPVSIQKEAFRIATKIKHKSLFNTFINCFYLSQNPDLIFPLLQNELSQGKAKDVCNFALKLDMQSKFTVEDLLVPLLINDDIQCIESFLDSSVPHRENFLGFLDKIIGREIFLSDYINDSNVRTFKCQTSNKFISKLGHRLMKKYNINTKVCPHIMKKQILGSVRYLFVRKYMNNEITEDSFICFLTDIAKENLSLREDILDLFVEYGDCELGASFLKLVDCKGVHIPWQIQKASEAPSATRKSIGSFQIEDELKDFYMLKKDLNYVHIISGLEDFDGAMDIIASSSVIAIDTEWKPSFHTNAKTEIALIQIATYNDIFLFDMINLPPILKTMHWHRIGSIFSNKNITKLVYGFHGDIENLSELHSILASHLKTMASFIDFNERKKVLEESFTSFFSFKPENEKGLSELIYMCFGKPLNKKHQFSYWSARPLSKDQITYAALDAYCLLDIETYLDDTGRKLKLPDWRNIKKASNKSNYKSNPNYQQPILSEKVEYPPTPASNFKVVCDNMVQGLGRLLRHCNIDTEILSSTDNHDKCATFYEREGRVALTRGNIYHQLQQHIPESHVYSISSDNQKEQLQDVVSTFNIVIREDDVFARCAECNSNSFLHISPHLIHQMRQNVSCNSQSRKSCWTHVKGGEVDLAKGITRQNTKIGFSDIHENVLEKVEVIYVCNKCGKCYWDGSHHDRVLRSTLSHVIKVDVPCVPVPPPQQLSSRPRN